MHFIFILLILLIVLKRALWIVILNFYYFQCVTVCLWITPLKTWANFLNISISKFLAMNRNNFTTYAFYLVWFSTGYKWKGLDNFLFYDFLQKKLKLNLLQRTEIAAYILISMWIRLQPLGFQMKLWLYGNSFFLHTKESIFLKSHRNKCLYVLVCTWIRKLSKKWIAKNVHFHSSGQTSVDIISSPQCKYFLK